MDTTILDQFDLECSRHLPDEIDKILKTAQGNNACSIGFITTDDFYGFYLAWDLSYNITEYFDWKNGTEPDFLYYPLVDVIDTRVDIDLCTPSEEKWAFALAVLAVLEKNIRKLPDEIFARNGFCRENILFFATMGDGDYITEMMDASAAMFNSRETLEAAAFHARR